MVAILTYDNDLFLGEFVPEPAPQHMPLSDIFSQEGGLFVVDLDDEALKLLTPSRKCKTLLINS